MQNLQLLISAVSLNNSIIKYGSFSMEVHVISDTDITVVTVGRQISAGPVMVISA